MSELLGVRFARVTINPEVIEDGGHGYVVGEGHMAYEGKSPRTKEEWEEEARLFGEPVGEWVKRSAKITFAGPAAEFIRPGVQPESSWVGDLLVGFLSLISVRTGKYPDLSRGRASKPELLDLIAEGLEDASFKAEVLEMIGEVGRILAERWPAVEAVAEALLERGEVEGTEFARIIADAPRS